MTQETSQTIRKWGDDTFGEVKDLAALVRRASVEMDELMEALNSEDHDEAGKEAADVVILLHRLMGLIGKDLDEEVDAKMAINRNRIWNIAGDGTGGHI